jgi:uncharacterized protein (TIGR02996 family)
VSDADALRAAVEDNPHDDTPRLMLADYLDDHGDQEIAALIRYQCGNSDIRPRKYRVSHQIAVQTLGEAAVWVNGFDRPTTSARGYFRADRSLVVFPSHTQTYEHGRFGYQYRLVVRRGFVDHVECSWEIFARHADAILAAAPVREVTLTTVPAVDSQHGQQQLRLVGEDVWHEMADLPAIRRGDIHSVIGRDRIRQAILSHRWPQVKTWNLPPEPTAMWNTIPSAAWDTDLATATPIADLLRYRELLNQHTTPIGGGIPTVGWVVEPVYEEVHLEADYSRLNPERMLREYRLHLEADSREVGRLETGTRFGPITGTLQDTGGRVRVESAVLVDVEPRRNSVILRAAPLAIPVYA